MKVICDLSDGFIALPGGAGTLTELCEMITWGEMGHHRKPCGLLNINGFFDSFLSQLDHAMREGFLKHEHREMILSKHDPESLLDSFAAYRHPSTARWLRQNSV